MASWPRCDVAGLFDVPTSSRMCSRWCPSLTGPASALLLDGEPLLRVGTRKLDLSRGVLLSTCRGLEYKGIMKLRTGILLATVGEWLVLVVAVGYWCTVRHWRLGAILTFAFRTYPLFVLFLVGLISVELLYFSRKR